jgi:hypothetical protein
MMAVVAATALTLGSFTTKHYDEYVPKDNWANVKYRAEMLQYAGTDKAAAAQMKQMCSEDPLFYVNTFCCSYSPMESEYGESRTPFTLYDSQCKVLLDILDSINRGVDTAIPKSRKQGLSWLGITAVEWCWHFREFLSFLLVSRMQDLVDDSNNPDSLFWKIDWLHRWQPQWLLPTGRYLGEKDQNRKLLRLKNADNESVIGGTATTENAGVAGRHTAILFDEFALAKDGYSMMRGSRDVTRCRIAVSTPRGQNHFYDFCEKVAAKVLRVHWSTHDIFKRGLYSMNEAGIVTLHDDFRGMVRYRKMFSTEEQEVLFPDDYPFQPCTLFTLRSPWFDYECTRCASEQEILQELEIDFLGSDYQFFSPEFIKALTAEYCTPPVLKGRLQYDPTTLEPYGFEVDRKGPLWLWFGLEGSGDVLKDRSFREGKDFGLGSDVSFGTGNSNSATAVVDLATGRKVALWKDPNTAPDDFADETVALAKWVGKGFMIWDASGPSGKTFTDRVIERKYNRIFYRPANGRTQRISDKPGYFLNPEDKAVLLRDYRWKLQERRYINPSESGLKECLQFVVQDGGRVEHSQAMNSPDPRGAREAHGDEVIADALAARLLTFKPKELKVAKQEAPWMSPAWRFEQEALEMAVSEREDW